MVDGMEGGRGGGGGAVMRRMEGLVFVMGVVVVYRYLVQRYRTRIRLGMAFREVTARNRRAFCAHVHLLLSKLAVTAQPLLFLHSAAY